MQGKKESFLYLATKTIVGLIGMFSFSIQTRYISPSVIGDFSLITGLTGVLVSVLVSWIGSAALRYYHSYKNSGQYREFCSTVTIDWILGVALCVCILLVGSRWIQSMPIRDYLGYVIFLVILASEMEILEKLMRASEYSGMYCFLLVFQSILNLLTIVVIFNLTNAQMESLFIAKMATSGMFVIVSLIRLKWFCSISLHDFSRDINTRFIAYGVPMIGVWGVNWLLNYSDRYVIRFFLTSTEVGLYDVSYRFTETSLGLVISSFSLAFFPALIKSWNDNGKDETCKLMTSILNYYSMLVVPALMGIVLLKDNFYGTIISENYRAASTVIAISGVGFAFMGINNLLYKLWQLEEKTAPVFYITIVSVALNLATNVTFIPRFGYMAAAVTTVVSYAITTIIICISLRDRFSIRLNLKMLYRVIVAAVIMGIFIFLFRPYVNSLPKLILCVCSSVVVYFAALCVIGGLSDEINTIKKLIAR